MASTSATGIACAAPTRGWAISRAALCLLSLALIGATPVSSLEIDIIGLRSAKGVLQLCLTREAGDFPDCRKGGNGIRRTIPAAMPRIRFEAIPSGNYAVAVIHDANGNARLDTLLGIPREGFGFSRDPAIRFGPPRFSAAEFALGSDAQVQQVRIRYLF